MAQLLRVFFNPKTDEKETMPYQPIEKLPELIKEFMQTNTEKFIKVCNDALDTEVTPKDEVPDNVACAQTISTLIKKVFPDFPIVYSTKDLDMKLYMDKRFKRITEPEWGCVVVSPRNNTQYGHAGMFLTSERIASNDSKTGLFKGNYSWSSWISEFQQKRGLRIYLYRLL